MVNKNLLEFPSKLEYIKYLKTLSNEEKEREFNVCDNLYSELFYRLRKGTETFNVEYRLKALDDIYYQKISDYQKYIVDYIEQIKKYLTKYYLEYIKEVPTHINTNKLMVNSYSYLISCENKTYEEAILILYDKITNEFNTGVFDRFKYLYSEVNRICDNFLNDLRVYKTEEMIYGLILDTSDIFSSLFDIELAFNQETLEFIVQTLTNYFEMISLEKIDLQNFFKNHLEKENYEQLKKYNCLNKIALYLMTSFVSVDLSDILHCFKNKKIMKIIDGDKEIILNDTLTVDNILYIRFVLDSSNVYKEVTDKYYSIYKEYDSAVEVLPGFCYGNPKEVYIIIGK